jgi:rubrerythrin
MTEIRAQEMLPKTEKGNAFLSREAVMSVRYLKYSLEAFERGDTFMAWIFSALAFSETIHTLRALQSLEEKHRAGQNIQDALVLESQSPVRKGTDRAVEEILRLEREGNRRHRALLSRLRDPAERVPDVLVICGSCGAIEDKRSNVPCSVCGALPHRRIEWSDPFGILERL